MNTDQQEKTDELVALSARDQTQENVYVRDASGAFFLEVMKSDGEVDYIPAEKGLEFVPTDNEATKWRVMRSEDVYAQQKRYDSHRAFMDKKVKRLESADEACRRMNWIDGMGNTLKELVLNRVAPPPIPSIKYVTDEQFIDLIDGYKGHCASGGRPADSDFQPLSAYVAKLVTKSGKIIRPVYAGEVGMEGPTVLVLKQGYGTGNFVSVPEKVGK